VFEAQCISNHLSSNIELSADQWDVAQSRGPF
jgi:hypothetical protein